VVSQVELIGTPKPGPERIELIDQQKIIEFSREVGLAANVVEKDYVIGWVLAGISDNPEPASSRLNGRSGD